MDKTYMTSAIEYAKCAYNKNEIPVGAIIVKDNKIVGWGYNQKESQNDPTSHAEINAIKMASKHLNDWRLNDTIMYVTLKPCMMCAGAIKESRISKVIYAINNINADLYFESDTYSQITDEEIQSFCQKLLQNFFKKQRVKFLEEK